MNAYILALLANLSFAFGSQFFTHYSRRFSPIWMNVSKALVAAFAFCAIILLTSGFHEISLLNFGIFFLSGFIALGIGDIFLLKAFSKIGPGRTMLLFGFHPVIVGILSFFILGQIVPSRKLIGIVFFLACLFIFSLETFKKEGKWDVSGLIFAFLGMAFDAVGVLITRYAFDMNSNITSMEGNFYRCLGALCSYLLIRLFINFDYFGNLRKLETKSKFYVLIGALFGTTISLGLYLRAIQTAQNLATITAISITSVIFASSFECIWQKKYPSKYLLSAFVFFAIGMKFVLF
ncbi:MAG: DMT family transporter [Bacteriovoracaceae bacterium]|nr:DMT family transporter [Bacteriovoracaceae bacterium]